MTAVGRVSDHRSELLEQQPENGLALAFGPVQVMGVVVKGGAGGAAFEAAPRTVVEIVGGEFRREGEVCRHGGRGLPPLIQGGFNSRLPFSIAPL